MSILDDTAIFAAIVQQGGFSRAARHLGFSNGLISRRIAQLESRLGVTLLKRTTRQLHLTPEGELLWQHAQRIQQELDSALCLIQSYSDKPRGNIRLSAPSFFGEHYLMPILNKFMSNFCYINIDLILTDSYLDPIKEKIDILIRGAGYFEKSLKDSSLKTKLLLKQKIGLYASPDYLARKGEPNTPEELVNHCVIGYGYEALPRSHETWQYKFNDNESSIDLKTKFSSNNWDCHVSACQAGHGITKLTDLIYFHSKKTLRPILQKYHWGEFNLFLVYAQQHALPKRTRLLMDFIIAHVQNWQENIIS